LLAASTTDDPAAPVLRGLVVLAPDGSVEMADRGGDHWLGALAGTGVEGIPAVVAAVADRARRTDDDGLATARVRTAAGHWLVVRGSVLGTGPDARVAVRLEPADAPQLAPLLVAAYGFTPQERRVTELVARGYSTKEVAAALEVAAYTVQDHLKSIFEKSGTSSRGELVSRLFVAGQAPRP
jgi:DNA-binding CsgD family transcriptional regulator